MTQHTARTQDITSGIDAVVSPCYNENVSDTVTKENIEMSATYTTISKAQIGQEIAQNESPKSGAKGKAGEFKQIASIERPTVDHMRTRPYRMIFTDGTHLQAGASLRVFVRDAVAPVQVGNHEAAEAVAAKADAKVVKAAKALSKCGCGCGKLVTRSFLPGHDAKLKGRLIQEAITGSAKARAELESRGWSHFLAKSEAKAARVAEARKAQSARNQARVDAMLAKKAEKAAAKAKPAKPAPALPETRVTGVRVIRAEAV